MRETHQESQSPQQAPAAVPRFPIVAMGASAGGLEAFQKFFSAMPPDSSMAFVLVQHLDPRRASAMTEIVSKHTPMMVQLAQDGMPVVPDNVYVIPPNATLTIREGVLRIESPVSENVRRMPIDKFLTSLAEDQGDNAVCIILSGSGTDGTLGLRAIKEHGGLTMAQAPETAKYDSMPRSAIPTGLVDFVLPIEEMPGKLMEYSRALTEFRTRMGEGRLDNETQQQLRKIIAAVKRRTGHDFSEYRQKTVVRRVQRRMQVLHIDTPARYVERLRSDPHEAEALFKEMLIGVTHFFRDPDAFESVASLVMPTLLEGRTPDDEIRIWVPACATGEETYSMAILVKEEMIKRDVRPQVRIFAGDIDDDGLEEARRARYPEGIAQHVSPERLERFFIKNGVTYQVVKEIREMCIFSTHNLIKNPPFSRLDLISCRNFMIYLETELQARLMPLFHYALRPRGFLFLGPSESIGSASDLFRVVDKKHRIFVRKEGVLTPPFNFPLADPREREKVAMLPAPRAQTVAEPRVGRTLEQLLLARFAPPGVLVNAKAEIVYISGRTGQYLEPSSGAPSSNVINMARRGLRLELRAALHQAMKNHEEVVQRGVKVESNGGTSRINLIVRPLSEDSRDELYMIIFQETDDDDDAPSHQRQPAERRSRRDDDRVLEQLESELQLTKDKLQSTVEELEASNEELKSSNEELLSMNEELQSANEELQTSKEELQSLNEELETVNTELTKKLEELDRAYSDLQNLFQGTNVSVLFVDKHLRIKKFTAAATALFRLIDADVGRPIADVVARFENPNLSAQMREVMRTLVSIDQQVHVPETNSTYTFRLAPYRTLDNVIDGLVLVFHDITAVAAAHEAQALLASIVSNSEDAIMSVSPQGTIISWNAGAERMFGYTAHEVMGRPILLLVPDERRDEIQLILDGIRHGETAGPMESVRVTKTGARLDVWFTSSILHDKQGTIIGSSQIMRDITTRKRADAELAAHRQHLEQLVSERTAELELSYQHLRLKERLAALGTLSAGLGHDLGNLLMPVETRLDAISARLHDDESTQDLDAIRECVEQLRHLSGGLRLLAVDPQQPVPGQVTDLNIWWQDVEALFRNILPRHATLRADFEPELPRMRIAKHQLTQAVFNLIQNAADALKLSSDGEVVLWSRREHDGSVVIGVTDNGPGMSEEVRRRCMEPFFSTKSRAFSTGLGLTLVQGVVKQVGGDVALTSIAGEGTTIALTLPAVDGQGPLENQPRPTAVIAIRDTRTGGYLRALLDATGFAHEPDSQRARDDAVLWIAEANETALQMAESFVADNPRRWAILLGTMPLEPGHDRIVVIEPKFAMLRLALQRIAETS